MSESMRIWLEVLFNVAYLLVVWGLVGLMAAQRRRVAAAQRPLARQFTLAFALLALGDTGHVGFRVWAYAQGGLDSTITVLGRDVGLVGLGALTTSITVTFFYMLMLLIWHTRYGKAYGWLGGLLGGAGVVRLLIIWFPGNAWNQVTPPFDWSLYRNIPLIIQGLGVAYLILRDARAAHDRFFTWVGVMILVSYAFYLPVILFVQQAPAVGMLMIPKTMAYVAIAFLAYAYLYRRDDSFWNPQVRPLPSTDG